MAAEGKRRAALEMESSAKRLASLSAAEYEKVEAMLFEFDQSWQPDALLQRVRELPSEGATLRQVVLVELVKIDLERHWKSANQANVEDYLAQFPELVGDDAVAIELLHAEYEARRRSQAPVDSSDFQRRFPRLANQLERLIQERHSPQSWTIELQVIKGPHRGKRFAFSEHDNFIVGRGKQAHFRLSKKDPYFSRAHFVVEVNPPQCYLMDMGSRNGMGNASRRLTYPTAIKSRRGIRCCGCPCQSLSRSRSCSPSGNRKNGRCPVHHPCRKAGAGRESVGAAHSMIGDASRARCPWPQRLPSMRFSSINRRRTLQAILYAHLPGRVRARSHRLRRRKPMRPSLQTGWFPQRAFIPWLEAWTLPEVNHQ